MKFWPDQDNQTYSTRISCGALFNRAQSPNYIWARMSILIVKLFLLPKKDTSKLFIKISQIKIIGIPINRIAIMHPKSWKILVELITKMELPKKPCLAWE